MYVVKWETVSSMGSHTEKDIISQPGKHNKSNSLFKH